jgi:hypothetical protein
MNSVKLELNRDIAELLVLVLRDYVNVIGDRCRDNPSMIPAGHNQIGRLRWLTRYIDSKNQASQ